MMSPSDLLSCLTLDQILLFVTVSDAGSFSAAARHLDRVQSTVSYGISQLEKELGTLLFERQHRKPVLSQAGQALLPEARRILTAVRDWQGHAVRLTAGEEAEVSLVLDMIIPTHLLIESLKPVQAQFPQVQWVVHSEVLSAITQRVIEGSVQLGLTGMLLPEHRQQLNVIPMGQIDFVLVVAKEHPLSKAQRVSALLLQQHVHLSVEDRGTLRRVELTIPNEQQRWRLAGLVTLKEFVVAGFGWGYLPVHMVQTEIKEGGLVALQPEHWPNLTRGLPIYAIHALSNPPGPVRDVLLKRMQKMFHKLEVNSGFHVH